MAELKCDETGELFESFLVRPTGAAERENCLFHDAIKSEHDHRGRDKINGH